MHELVQEANEKISTGKSKKQKELSHKIASTGESQISGDFCAIDPGVRTFLTVYTPTSVFKLGERFYDCLIKDYKAISQIDKMIAKQTKNKKRRALSVARLRHFENIKHKVKDFHYKILKFFSEMNFDLIFIPDYQTKPMTSKSGKLPKIVRKAMNSLSFYLFKQRAFHKELNLVNIDESYTSKTASWSGQEIKVGSSESISDGIITLDRDINAARGILIKGLSSLGQAFSGKCKLLAGHEEFSL